jgi:hypothetical protein
MKSIFLMALSGFILLSCTKHKGDYEASIPVASIVFATPTEGSNYHLADSIPIQARCISTGTIHGCDVTIRKAGDTTVYFSSHIHDHNDTLNIRQVWKNTFSESTSLEVRITLFLDHEGHTLTKKTGFRVQ